MVSSVSFCEYLFVFVCKVFPFYLQSPEERGVFMQILESGYRFALGSIAGGKCKV